MSFSMSTFLTRQEETLCLCVYVCACPQDRKMEKPLWCFVHHSKHSCLMVCIDECSGGSLGGLHGNKHLFSYMCCGRRMPERAECELLHNHRPRMEVLGGQHVQPRIRWCKCKVTQILDFRQLYYIVYTVSENKNIPPTRLAISMFLCIPLQMCFFKPT